MTIEKKCWPEYFEAVLQGKKSFELRLNDFEIETGDYIVLKEWNPETEQYTGRRITKRVGFIFETKKQTFFSDEDVEKHGFKIMQLED